MIARIFRLLFNRRNRHGTMKQMSIANIIKYSRVVVLDHLFSDTCTQLILQEVSRNRF